MGRCRPFPLLLAVGVALLVAACGGEGGGATPTPAGTAPALTPTATAPTANAVPSAVVTPSQSPVIPTPTEPVATLPPTGALAVGIDMDPFAEPANSCPGTGTEDCTLGSIETCKSVPNLAGETFSVDTFIQGLPRGFLAWNYNLLFPDTTTPARLTLSSIVAEADPLVNLIAQSEGSVPLPLSEEVPDPPGSTEPGSPFHAAVAEWGTAENTPPFTQGVLARYEFTVGEGAENGVYAFTLDPEFVGILDEDSIMYTIDVIGSGLVALGEDCP
jgi:hypothetical protein